MVERYEDRFALPVGVLEDCRLVMAAEYQARLNAEQESGGRAYPTQDLIAQDRAANPQEAQPVGT